MQFPCVLLPFSMSPIVGLDLITEQRLTNFDLLVFYLFLHDSCSKNDFHF